MLEIFEQYVTWNLLEFERKRNLGTLFFKNNNDKSEASSDEMFLPRSENNFNFKQNERWIKRSFYFISIFLTIFLTLLVLAFKQIVGQL